MQKVPRAQVKTPCIWQMDPMGRGRSRSPTRSPTAHLRQVNASGDHTRALLLPSVPPQPKLKVSTDRPAQASQEQTLHTFFAKSGIFGPHQAQRPTAHPHPRRRGEQAKCPHCPLKVPKAPGQRKAPRPKSLPRAFCARGLGGTKGRWGEGPDGSDGAKPPPPLAGRGHRRRASPASAARPPARGDPGPATPLAVTPALGRAGHLSPRSPSQHYCANSEPKFCNRGRARDRKVPGGTFHGRLPPRPAEPTGPGERQADLGAALPAPPGKPGSWPSRASTPRVAGAPRGRARARASPGPPGRPRPRPPCLRAPALGSARSAAGPRVAGRQPPSCSPPAREGRSRLYLHKGRAGGAREPRAPGGGRSPGRDGAGPIRGPGRGEGGASSA